MGGRAIAFESREYRLMREIQAQLEMWKSKNGQFRAADYSFTMDPNKWAEIMAWAELGLRDYVITQCNYIDNEAVNIRPIMLEQQS